MGSLVRARLMALLVLAALPVAAGPLVASVAAEDGVVVASTTATGTAPTDGTAGTGAGDPTATPATTSVVPADPPACRYADLSAVVDPDAPHLTPLDTAIALKRAYTPTDLVPVSRAGLPGGGLIRRVVISDLRAMTRAAAADGIRLASVSAYRSYATQIATFSRWRSMVGADRVRLYSARPGHSEHQLGTTLDFAASGGPRPWTYADWARTKAGAWVAAHGWEYGFVMTYPRRGSPAVSCYAYEPWHWRWVGREVARTMHDDSVIPRVWLWRWAMARQ